MQLRLASRSHSTSHGGDIRLVGEKEIRSSEDLKQDRDGDGRRFGVQDGSEARGYLDEGHGIASRLVEETEQVKI